MQLTKDQIKHIASLARLELSDEELGRYGNELSNILGYIDQLAEVDVAGIEPTAQVTGLLNIFREDEIRNWPEDEIGQAILDAPGREGKNIKVKRVLE